MDYALKLLALNWIWLALGAAAFAFFAYRRLGCGEMSHDNRRPHSECQDDRARKLPARETTMSDADSTNAPLQPSEHPHGAAPGKVGNWPPLVIAAVAD